MSGVRDADRPAPACTPGHQLVVWLITDGKPGHRNQLEGLRLALHEANGAEHHWIEAMPPIQALLGWMRRRFPPGRELPRPDLIVVAGHRTHWSGLAARRARGGQLAVLMRPSLPLRWFDVCIVPLHDAVPERPNVIRTEGVLNAIRHSVRHDPARGLILIGGPSRHHDWDEPSLLDQIGQLIASPPDRRWTLTTSRRTPSDTLHAICARFSGSIEIRPADETPPDWVGEQLAIAGEAWVTEDSVSMVFEALGSGAATGLLAVPRAGTSRVARSIDRLVEQGMLTRFEQWRSGCRLAPPTQPLCEAARVARLLVARLDGEAASG